MITKLNIKPQSGHQSIFQIGEDEITWLGLDILRLAPGETWQAEVQDEEAALIALSGRFSVEVNNGAKSAWSGVGGRADIFSASPWAVYAPRRCKFTITAETQLELAVAKAPSDIDLPPTLVKPDTVRVVSAGVANWRRDVRLVIPPGSPISQRLIVGETINPPGNWSGIPPHKHDEISGVENILEEFYLYKVKPTNGYGVQLGYKDDQELSFFIRNDDVYLLKNGFHPTVAAPGTTLGYLWVLSGDDKAYSISTDPVFDWVTGAEAVIRESQK